MLQKKNIFRLILLCLFISATPVALITSCSPRPAVKWLAGRHPEVLYYVETSKKVVALTIDDGPHPTVTPRLLDLLERNGAHVTFFVIGERVPGQEALLQRMIDDGHEIGNHLMNTKTGILLSAEAFASQLQENHAILSRYGEMVWMRPPSGFFNRRMLQQVEDAGYQCALGSVYPFDPQLPFAPFLSSYIKRNVFPGSIIILHDGMASRMRTVSVLESVLPVLAERGYRVVSLSELVQLTSNPAARSLLRDGGGPY